MSDWDDLHCLPTVGDRLKAFLNSSRAHVPEPSCSFSLKIFFFLMWTIVKVFIEFVIILLLLYVLVFCPGGTWDLISSTKDQTHTLCIGRWSINHWSTMEVPTLALEFLSRAHASSPFCLNASKATSLSFPQCHQSRLSVWLAVY